MSAFVVGLLTGVLSGCGIGGGSLLLLWLTLVQDMPQFTAGASICCISSPAPRPRSSLT